MGIQLQCQQFLERIRAMRLRPLGAWGPEQLASHVWDVINIDGAYITVGSSEG